ncbi:hypothetical protein [Microvirga rosea]|uniref:hypothetical protein n=1 Tax=Microvirga rosea TaxID=2715425 RepID=UPI001D0A983F|nr:hypothetical protein [Microvirga rosea]MCB8821010.1 hypothetical protein [Microvirga rosea]
MRPVIVAVSLVVLGTPASAEEPVSCKKELSTHGLKILCTNPTDAVRRCQFDMDVRTASRSEHMRMTGVVGPKTRDTVAFEHGPTIMREKIQAVENVEAVCR